MALSLLLAILAGALIGANALYPRRTPVYRPTLGPIFVKVQDAQHAPSAAILVHVWPKPKGTFLVTFLVNYIASARSARAQHLVGVSVLLPHGVAPQSCAPITLPPSPAGLPRATELMAGFLGPVGPCVYHALGDGAVVSEKVRAGVSRVPVAKLSFVLKSRALTWSANGLTVDGLLPMTRGFSYHGSDLRSSLPRDTQVTIVYHVANAAHYDWTAGPPPSSNSSPIGTWWNESLQALSSPVGVSGTNGSASSADSSDTFIAGALLGVAGAAAIAVVQEVTRSKEDLPAGTSRSGQTSGQRL